MAQPLKSYEDGRKLAAFVTLHPQGQGLGDLAALADEIAWALEEMEQPEGYWCSGGNWKPDAPDSHRGGRVHLSVYFIKREERA